MLDHVSLPKHVRCEYNEREPCYSYASSYVPFTREMVNACLCLLLNEAPSVFQLSRVPNTFFVLDKAIYILAFVQNV